MIGVIFLFNEQSIEVRIDNNSVLFRTPKTGNGFVTIDSLHLSKDGVIKEFPELKNHPSWREEAIKKFKEKVSSLTSEIKKMNYIIEDLSKHGYVALAYQKKGHRVVKL